ncbi:helix-turn-helix domain-containing protein [Streptomyces sp. NPDC088789]|uniref:helix-turn-helix domain-containing protein n=1 Tax=Streptomyces sp. NPDC088789 TaxID=3365899 RepID=UPI003812C8A9
MSRQILALVGQEGQLPPATPQAAAQLIGAVLRHLRSRAGLHLKDVVREIPHVGSVPTLQRCEKPKTTVSPERVRILLDFYQAPPEIREEMETLLQQPCDTRWWTRYSDVAGTIMESLFALESDSKVIKTCHQILIPGMLQTAGYARAVMNDFYGTHTDPKKRAENLATVERRLEMRLRRQHLLDQPDAPEFGALIAEQAVRKELGGRNVMREQLRHLFSISENKPHVHIRILPESALRSSIPAHPAMTLYKPHDSASGRTVYLEDMNRGGTLYADGDDLEAFQASIEEWWAKAYSKQETQDCLQDCIEGLSTTGDGGP